MLVKNLINTELFDKRSKNNLFGKKVHLTANCSFFPDFDLTGILISLKKINFSYIIYINLSKNKPFKVDALMNGLDIEIID
jgi:hypothetical protein